MPAWILLDGLPWDDPVIRGSLDSGHHAALLVKNRYVDIDCDTKSVPRETDPGTTEVIFGEQADEFHGTDVLEALCASHGIEVPATLEITSISGGMRKHLLFRQDTSPGLAVRHRTLGEHGELEIRASRERKYVVVAGPGYEANETSVITIPEALRNAIAAAEGKIPGTGAGRGYIAGGENNAIFVLFRQASDAGLFSGEDEARNVLLGMNAGLNHPYDEDALLKSSLREGLWGEPKIPLGGMSWAQAAGNRDTGFWNARAELRYIHDLARARLVSPEAVLGAVLARAVMKIPPSVVLPGIIGSVASLNLFMALCGKPGAGKGGAMRVAEEVVPLPGPCISLGSGEGLLHQYVFWDQKNLALVQYQNAVLFMSEEAETVSGIVARQASTLLPELRKGWMGEGLGFAYADRTRRLSLASHSYRMCVLLGMQPSKAAFLLDDSAGGTPQRLHWFSADDPAAPEIAPDGPEQWQWKGWKHLADVPPFRHELGVCSQLREDIIADRLERRRGGGDEKQGHHMLAREKVSAALALLAQHDEVTEEDWQLGAVVMSMSDAVLESISSAVASERARDNNRRGRADGERTFVADETRHSKSMLRVAARIMAFLHECGAEGAPRSDIRKKLALRDRGFYEDAAQHLCDMKQVVRDGQRLRVIEYGA
jgi:hypothetical protein